MDAAAAERLAAGASFFETESERIARCCHAMAERFARGGRLLALGASPPARSDARHVSVEFVHPVIVGKRALPALALTAEGGSLRTQLETLARADDMVIGFGLDEPEPDPPGAGRLVGLALAAASARGCLTIGFGPSGPGGPSGEHHWSFEPPSDDLAIRQELVETLYHVLWELVHVFFDHRGLLEGRSERPRHDAGGAGFLYPFLSDSQDSSELDAVLADVAASARGKSEEVGELRRRTLAEAREELVAAAIELRARLDAGGRVLAFGNGGSATDAMDLVADLRSCAGRRLAPRAAIDLTEDSPIITAVANDVGVREVFQRQLIALGGEGDAAVAFSTSGGSENLIEGLAEARRRGMLTIAMLGYDGGRVLAEGLADFSFVCRSQSIPRIQEAQASVYHLLVELLEIVGEQG